MADNTPDNFWDDAPRKKGDVLIVNLAPDEGLATHDGPAQGWRRGSPLLGQTKVTYTGKREEGKTALDGKTYAYVEVQLDDGSTAWVAENWLASPTAPVEPAPVRTPSTQDSNRAENTPQRNVDVRPAIIANGGNKDFVEGPMPAELQSRSPVDPRADAARATARPNPGDPGFVGPVEQRQPKPGDPGFIGPVGNNNPLPPAPMQPGTGAGYGIPRMPEGAASTIYGQFAQNNGNLNALPPLPPTIGPDPQPGRYVYRPTTMGQTGSMGTTTYSTDGTLGGLVAAQGYGGVAGGGAQMQGVTGNVGTPQWVTRAQAPAIAPVTNNLPAAPMQAGTGAGYGLPRMPEGAASTIYGQFAQNNNNLSAMPPLPPTIGPDPQPGRYVYRPMLGMDTGYNTTYSTDGTLGGLMAAQGMGGVAGGGAQYGSGIYGTPGMPVMPQYVVRPQAAPTSYFPEPTRSPQPLGPVPVAAPTPTTASAPVARPVYMPSMFRF